jgi:hypothetical protein
MFLKDFLLFTEYTDTRCNKAEMECLFPLFMQPGNYVSGLASDWRENLASH